MGAMTFPEAHEASYRDPDGFIFESNGQILRQINPSYAEDYERLMKSGLYEALIGRDLLIPHREIPLSEHGRSAAYKVIQPDRVPFISYAYEWSFSQLKAAAIASLEIMETALAHGMMLKDCNSFNIQFQRGRPVLIDTLSFMSYQQGMLWPGYRQFCQHFLMTLALMSYCDPRLNALLARFEDGIPLDLGCELLPLKARFSVGLLVHLFIHSSVDRRAKSAQGAVRQTRPTTTSLIPLVANLKRSVERIKPPRFKTAWEEYERVCLYSQGDRAKKKAFVEECLESVDPGTVWDLGANVGTFSWLAARQGASVVAIDNDHAAMERLSQQVTAQNEPNILPLVIDILNPSPPIGWENAERSALLDRGPADLIMALALLHHVVIGANVPLPKVARLLARLGNHVVIEFVPKADPQVELLLAHRRDIFPDYHQQGFEDAFGEHFRIVRSEVLDDSPRILYQMERTVST
jgi:hypothetical protein